MLQQLTTARQKFIKTTRGPFGQNRERFLQENIKGVMGSTWDAIHMTSFLSKSFYSNKQSPQHQDNPQRNSYSNRRRQSGDYFFKNLRYDQNKSHIGYTKVNPLVVKSPVEKDRQKVLVDFFLSRKEKIGTKNNDKESQKETKLRYAQGKFKFEGNKVKFIATDPLTSRYEPQQPQKLGFSMERMKRQINSRYPHGITGIDHPQHQQTQFYQRQEQKSPRIREHPTSRTSFQLDREWKHKKRVTPISEEFRFRHTECIRKFRNENVHGYDIVSNRKVE